MMFYVIYKIILPMLPPPGARRCQEAPSQGQAPHGTPHNKRDGSCSYGYSLQGGAVGRGRSGLG